MTSDGDHIQSCLEVKSLQSSEEPSNFTVAMQRVWLPIGGKCRSRPRSKALNINELVMDVISQQLLRSDLADLAQR